MSDLSFASVHQKAVQAHQLIAFLENEITSDRETTQEVVKHIITKFRTL